MTVISFSASSRYLVANFDTLQAIHEAEAVLDAELASLTDSIEEALPWSARRGSGRE